MDPRPARRSPPQRSLLLTLAISTVVSALTVYILIAQQLKRFDNAVATLSERIDQQFESESTQLKSMSSELQNETQAVHSALTALTISHASNFRQISHELRNHSRLVAKAIDQQSTLYSQQIKDLSVAVRESTLSQAEFGPTQLLATLTNQTKYTMATLHSQRRMEKDLMEVLKLVDERQEGGRDFQKSVETTLEEVLSVMRRHTQVQKSAQETLDALTALLASQNSTAGKGVASARDQVKVHEVLKALVAHLRNEDRDMNVTSGSQSALIHRMDLILHEVRNSSSLALLLKAVRQQSLFLLRLRTQLAPLLHLTTPAPAPGASPLDAIGSQLTLLGRKVDSLAGEGRASLLTEMKSQTQVLMNLDARMDRIEERVGLRVEGKGEGKGAAGEGDSLSDPGRWKLHELAGDPAKFMRYSGYRWGPSQMTAVGLGVATIIQSLNLTACSWHFPNGSALQGSLAVLFAPEGQSHQYEVTILTCTFLVNVSQSTGGHLLTSIDGSEFVLYRESPQESPAQPPVPRSVPSLTVCVSPVPSPPWDLRVLREFVEVQRLQGTARKVLFFDSGGLGQPFASLFSADLAAGFVSVAPLFGLDKIDQQLSGELLAYHDCLYAAKAEQEQASDWLTFLEPNEFFYLPGLRNLPGLLSLAGSAGQHWLSLGSVWYASQKCRPASQSEAADVAQRFSYERMIFRWPFVLCHDTQRYPDRDFCLGGTGHRRLLLQPSQMSRVGLHAVHAEDEARGAHVSASEAVHFHFQNLLRGPACSEVIPGDTAIEWWYRNQDGSSFLEALRTGLHCNFTDNGCTNTDGGPVPKVVPMTGDNSAVRWKSTAEVTGGREEASSVKGDKEQAASEQIGKEGAAANNEEQKERDNDG